MQSSFNSPIFRSEYLLLLFFPLFPYYIFPSAMPQPVHWLFLIGIVPFLWSTRPHWKIFWANDYFRFFLLFALYTLIVNLVFAGLFNQTSPLKYPLYYFFLLFLSFGFFRLFSLGRLPIAWFVISLVIALLIQGLLLTFLEYDKWRIRLFFNNPNQLGLFAVTSALLLVFIHEKLNKQPLMLTFGLFFSTYIGLSSTSRGAILGLMLLGILYALYLLIGRKIHLLLLVLIAFSLGFTAASWRTSSTYSADQITDDLFKLSASTIPMDELKQYREQFVTTARLAGVSEIRIKRQWNKRQVFANKRGLSEKEFLERWILKHQKAISPTHAETQSISEPKEVSRHLSLADRMNVMSGKKNKVNQWIKRGYGRILDYPKFLIFGAGEGVNHGFRHDREFHSLPGTLVFSYGLVGLAFLLTVIFLIFKAVRWHAVLYLLPLVPYVLTHNALRHPLIWLLVVFLLFHETFRQASVNRNSPSI